ncbi:hypothetical protein ACHAWF_016665, partial [Thalassiosira exigua]
RVQFCDIFVRPRPSTVLPSFAFPLAQFARALRLLRPYRLVLIMTPSSSPPALSPRSRAAAAARARRAAPAGDALTGSKPTEAESNGDEGSSLTRRAKPLTKIRRKIGTNIRCTLFGVNDPASSVGLIGVLGLIFLGAMPASAASNDTLAVIEKTKGAHPNEAKMLRRISKKSKSKGDKESKSRSTKSSKAKPSTCPAPGQGNCFQGPIACSGIQNCLRCKNGTFEGTACGGAYNCENNSGRIVSACTTYGSCNFNFGCINGTESSSTCTGSSSCNTNMGTIEEGTCNGPFSCNNVPVGHVINAGTCNGYAECNFPPPQRLNPPGQCFQEQSSCIGFSVCEDCAPSGRITGSSCGGAFDCEKNSGTIAFACTTYSSCNYNSGSILGTESMRACSGASSCNYNKGVIEEGACGGLNSCNNNPAGSRIAAGTCNEENSCNADPSPTQSAQESSTQVERLDLETPKCVRDVTACSGFQNCQGCEVAVEVDLVEGFIPAASTIGTYSCTTNTCCGNNRGIIGSAACNGWYSCNNNGGTIRSYSCSTEMSCRDNRGIISEGACNGPSSCNNVPEGTVIPPYSCNGFNQCNFAPSPPSPPSPQPPSTPTPTPAVSPYFNIVELLQIVVTYSWFPSLPTA